MSPFHWFLTPSRKRYGAQAKRHFVPPSPLVPRVTAGYVEAEVGLDASRLQCHTKLTPSTRWLAQRRFGMQWLRQLLADRSFTGKRPRWIAFGKFAYPCHPERILLTHVTCHLTCHYSISRGGSPGREMRNGWKDNLDREACWI